jgi:hypothetical protein
MTALPIAHAGHWLVNVLYIVPLVVIVGMLMVSSIKDRRAEAAEAAAAPRHAVDEPDEQAAP